MLWFVFVFIVQNKEMCKMSYKTYVSWEGTFNWISSVKSDKYAAQCKACKKSFRIDEVDGEGIPQIP